MVQRVKRAEVKVDGITVSAIGPGLLTLLGVATGDTDEKLLKTVRKIIDLRVFEDEAGKMNKSLRETGGEHLIVSQFTLLGDCSQGRRPAFTGAEKPERAKVVYEKALEISRSEGVRTSGGVFQAHMEVSLVNDGPVTLLIEY